MMLEVSTQGKDVHQLLPGWHKPPDECCGSWTPDGKYFVFMAFYASNCNALFQFTLATGSDNNANLI